eukprot:gene3291-28036_t
MEESTPKPPAAMTTMVPKPPSTPKGPASAGSSRASSAGSPKSSDVGGVRRGMKKPTPVQKGSKKSKPKTKVVDANGKKVVDTSWKAKVTINLYNTHYPVLKDVVNDLGFTIAKDTDMSAFLIWYNSAPPNEAIKGLKNYQKINHFPASSEISRKDSLARNLAKMQPYFPSEFNFFPKSWILPAEYGQFKSYADQHRQKGRPKTFIYKPTNSAQGKGLWGRMADVMLKTLMVALPQNVHEYRVSRRVPANAHSTAETASQCFAIYGFDIFLDKKLNPYVIEVNRSPSFACDAPLDREIKYGVLSSAFKLLKLRPSEKAKSETLGRKQAQGRLFGPAAKAVVAAAKLRRASSKSGSSGRDGWISGAGGAIATTEAADRAAVEAIAAARAEEEAAATTKAKQESANAIKLEEERNEAEEARCAYEAKHLGSYRRIYPLADPTSDRAQVYQHIIDESTQAYFKSGGTGTKVPRSKMPREATFSDPDAAAAAAAVGDCDAAGDFDTAGHDTLREGGAGAGADTDTLRTGSGNPIPPIPSSPKRGGSGTSSPLGAARAVDNVSGPECQGFLASLRGMRIACPGHTDEETIELIRQVRGSWDRHSNAVGQYWLQTLDRRRRVDIIKIVQSNVLCIIGTFWPTSVSGRVRVVQVINRMFDRLTWHNGHNLFKTFSVTLAHSLDGLINISHTSVLEQQCCHRVVELCQDCLLVVYLCSRQITLQMNEDGSTSTNLDGLAEQEPAPAPAHRGPALTTLAFD